MRCTVLILALAAMAGCRHSPTDGTTTGLEGCWNVHEHSYTHQWSYTEGYETYAWVRGARIYLHDDLLAVADMDELACPDLDAAPDAAPEDTWTADCSAGLSYRKYGTTTVELVQGDTTTAYPDYMEWTFGIDNEFDALFIVGPNEGNDTPSEDQDIAVEIGWSPAGEGVGTTSADFFVDYWIYDQACGNDTDADCWSQTDEPQNPGVVGEHWSPESDIVAKDAADCIIDEG